MAQYDDLDNKRIFLVGVVSALLVFVTILAVQVLYFAMQEIQSQTKVLQSEYTENVRHLSAQAEALEAPPLVLTGEDRRTIHIPIQDAIAIVADERYPEKKSPDTRGEQTDEQSDEI